MVLLRSGSSGSRLEAFEAIVPLDTASGASHPMRHRDLRSPRRSSPDGTSGKPAFPGAQARHFEHTTTNGSPARILKLAMGLAVSDAFR